MFIGDFKSEELDSLTTDVSGEAAATNNADPRADFIQFPPSRVLSTLLTFLKVSTETPFVELEDGLRPIFIDYQDLINYCPENSQEKNDLVWFGQEVLVKLVNKKSSLVLVKKIFDIINAVLQNYVHETEHLHLFKNRQWLIDLISIVFSLLIVKLDVLKSPEECILLGVPVARSCTRLLLDKISKFGSYDIPTLFADFMQAFSDFLTDEPDDLSRIFKLLDLLLWNKNYMLMQENFCITHPLNFICRLYDCNQVFSYNYRSVLPDITKTTLVYGIFSAIDDFFGEHTSSRNVLVEGLWIRINIVFDYLCTHPILQIKRDVIVSDILKKFRDLNKDVMQPQHITLVFENMYLDFNKLQTVFTQATFAETDGLQNYTVSQIDETSLYGRLKYSIIKYILLNTLEYILTKFTKKYALQDQFIEQILIIYTWRTIAFLQNYIYNPSFDKTSIFTPEEYQLFRLAETFVLNDLDKPKYFEDFTQVEQAVLKINRVILIPTDWGVLLSLLLNSPITELRDVLVKRFNHLDECYAICYSSAKAFFVSLKQLYYLTTNNTEKYEDLENQVLMGNYLESIITNYLDNNELVVNKMMEIHRRNEIPDNFVIAGMLKVQLLMQSLYELQHGFNQDVNFVSNETSAQNMFDDLSFSVWPESLFIMTMLTGSENTVSFIFPWFEIVNRDPPQEGQKKKSHKKALVRQFYKEYMTGGTHITNSNLELFGL